MKTERRHELQTNWLADRVNEGILVTKPYMKGLVGIVLALLVLWGTYMYLAHRAEAEEAGNWNKLWDGFLGGPTANEDIQSLAESNPKQPTGEWARLLIADNDLTIGVGYLFTEKTAGHNKINSALDNYNAVLANSTDPLIREHALYGVGRAEESLCKLHEAEKAYKQLRIEFPNGAYGFRAKERLGDLARESTQDRYDSFFSKIEPLPSSGLGKGTSVDAGVKLPAELEPFSQFANPDTKTPPPDPKPDKGTLVPKDSKPGDKVGEIKPADTKTPSTKTPDAKTPDAKAPDTKSPDVKAPDAKTPDAKAPDIKTPDVKAPDTKTPDTKATDPKSAKTAPSPDPKPDDSKQTPPKQTDVKP